MNPDKILSELEEKTELYRGQELKAEVESVLEENAIDYRQIRVGGLEVPKHKAYTYKLDDAEDSYELDVILWDGRPGHEDGSVKLEQI